jgi:hypothetical protein
MFTRKTICLLAAYPLLFSCVSTKSTLKNVDANAPIPKVSKASSFILTTISTDPKYGYDKDYPINVFYRSSVWEEVNQKLFLDALAGPNGEAIEYKRVGICCPFPSKNVNTGGGFLDIYEITYDGLSKPIVIYLNKYEKGVLMAPMGFTIKKIN